MKHVSFFVKVFRRMRNSKKKFVGRCACCDMNFYSHEATERHFESVEHKKRAADELEHGSAVKAGRANRMSILTGL